MPKENKKASGPRYQPYRRDPDIARFQTSRRAGRRNAVTQEDSLTVAAVAAKYSSQLAADHVTDATSEHVSNSQTTETSAASLPADLSKLKFGDEAVSEDRIQKLSEKETLHAKRQR